MKQLADLSHCFSNSSVGEANIWNNSNTHFGSENHHLRDRQQQLFFRVGRSRRHASSCRKACICCHQAAINENYIH